MVARDVNESVSTNPYVLARTITSIARRSGHVTRSGLMATTASGKSIVAQRVAELIELGILIEGTKAPSTGGRAPRGLHFNGPGALLIGVEVNARAIDVAVTEVGGRPLQLITEPNDVLTGPRATLDRVVTMINRVIENMPAGHPPVLGVGVGMPGPVDFAARRMVAPPALPDWDGFPVGEHLAELLCHEVWVDNDVNAMAIGEQAMTPAGDTDDVIVVSVGSGIGAGIILRGRIFRGAAGGAGDIGHVAYGGSSTPCFCGKRGCLSTVAGGVSLARRAERLVREGSAPWLAANSDGALDVSDVARAVAHGDSAVADLVRESGTEIGRVIALMVGIVNPARIVLASELCEDNNILLDAVRSSMFAHAPALGARQVILERSRLGRWAGAVGAAMMCVDEILTADRIREWVEARRRPFALMSTVGVDR